MSCERFIPSHLYIDGFERADCSGTCSCGRKHPLIKPIETKLEDCIITSNGNIIPGSILHFPIHDVVRAHESQVVQTYINRLVIKIVPEKIFSKNNINKLIDDMHSRIGDEMTVEVEMVDTIPRTENGKFRFVISDVANKYLRQ